MSKLPFLIRHGFNIVNKVKGQELFAEMTPKKNLWFYLFAFIEAFKCICNIEKVEECEDNNAK